MIREAQKQDIPAIALLERECQEVSWSEQLLFDSFALGDQYDFFVDDTGGKIVAYGFIQWILDEGDICNIATKKEFRNTGRASGILKIMEEKAKERNVTKLFLEVNENNAAALNLYKKAGFKAISRRANYYGKAAAIVMKKEI